jgi:hypothetical protein
MYRERFSKSTGPADFPGALVQLTRPKQMFIEHVDYPNQASLHRRMLPKIVFVLIETAPADHARQDFDPITLQIKGLLIEEARTKTLI